LAFFPLCHGLLTVAPDRLEVSAAGGDIFGYVVGLASLYWRIHEERCMRHPSSSSMI